MPKHADFVIAAYAFWVVAFVIYAPWVHHKLKKTLRAINDLKTRTADET